MATRSLIGATLPDGSIIVTYCHYDGCVKGGVGEQLVEQYTGDNAYLVANAGYLSFLPDIDEWDEVNERGNKGYFEDGDYKPAHAHKGGDDYGFFIESKDKYIEEMAYSDCEYAYLWDDEEQE